VSDAPDGRAERDELAFFGVVVASVTHELNNVLSIIDQVGGLLGDLATKAAVGGRVDPERLKTLHGRIDRQVRKGIEIVHHLNGFAHSLDDPRGPFDASETLEDLLALSARFADLRKVGVVRTDWVDWSGTGDAFLFQRGVHEAFGRILAEANEGDRIEIDSRRDGGAGVVSISGSAKSSVQDDDEAVRRLAGVMRALGGEYRLGTNDRGGTVLELRLPTRSEGRTSREGN
jgi:hypothetical protein